MLKSNSVSFPIRKLAIIGVLGAISAVLGMTPLGFIPIGPTRATIMHIPVIIGAIMEGPIVGMMIGLIFGVFSIIQAITNPTPVSFVFLNPLVSVLPRILIGLVAYYSYAGFKKLGRKTSMIVLSVVWLLAMYYLISNFIDQIELYRNGSIQMWKMLLSGAFIIIAACTGYFSYKKLKSQSVEIVVSAALSTLTNTIGVLFMIYILYAEQFVQKLGIEANMAGKVIMGIGITNGIPEAIVAMLIVTNVVTGLKKKV